MGERLAALPQQCASAWRHARQLSLPRHWLSMDRVIISGMGGSAIAGDLVADLASQQGTLPVTVVRAPRLPFPTDQHTLVIACSYSGNTEETLALFRQAAQAGGPVLAVTGGGDLLREAKERGVPVLPIEVKSEPRNAVGCNLMLLLGVLESLGLMKTSEDEALAGASALQQQVSRLRPEAPRAGNPAKQLAAQLLGKLIVVYGGGIFSGVAQRWKTQLNENAKTWAFYETLPELMHNSVEAYGAAPAMKEGVLPLLLQPKSGPEWLMRRYGVLAALLEHHGIPFQLAVGRDGAPLTQLLDMLILGDFVSYYLAMLREIDPSPTPTIVEAKTRLSSRLRPRGK
jgi:glucose/mannose-6-phosphate isomerase